MKKLICAFLVCIILIGCDAKKSIQEQTNNDAASMESFDENYYKIVNFGGSELREDFYVNYGGTNDFMTIGMGLQILSSEYFSTSSYYLSEGQYFHLADKPQLLRRSDDPDEYPYTLQPAKGTKIDGVSEPIMVSDIQEQDYYTKEGSQYTLKGISFAIIIDPTDSKGQVLSTPLSDSRVEEYGRECIEKFYQFIREYESFEDIKDLPILITVYHATNTATSEVDGNYILKSYCQKELGHIDKVNHENVIFSSSRAEEIDKTTYSDFNIIKQNVKNAGQEAAGFQATARYMDGQIQSMVINANLNVKTSSELMSLTSLIADNISQKFTYDFHIKVLVNSQDGLEAIIIKDKGQKARSSILY